MVREGLPRTYYIICNNPKLAKQMLHAHQKIVESLKAHDEKKTRAYMSRHWVLAYEASRRYLDHITKSQRIASGRGRENARTTHKIEELEDLKLD